MSMLRKKVFFKIVILLAISHIYATRLSAQSNLVLIDEKVLEETIVQNRGNSLPDFSGLYSKLIISIEDTDLSQSDSLDLYKNLTVLSGTISCYLNFQKQEIEMIVPKEKNNEGFSKIKEILNNSNIGAVDYKEYLYKQY